MARKNITQEEANKRDIEAGFEVLNPVEPFISTSTKRKYKCQICKEFFFTKPDSIWRKLPNAVINCRMCANKRIGKSKRLTQEEAEAKSLAVGIKMIGQYKDNHTKTEFKCPYNLKGCTETFLACPGDVWKKVESRTKSCGCYQGWKGTYDISAKHLSHIQHHARSKNNECNITLDDMQILLDKQNHKCALTNLPIVTARTNNRKLSTYSEQTASLDRIDSSKGYIINNIQWVHKDINRLKTNFKQDRFIELCKLVASHNE
ncbi:MAG: hypothetical protein WCP24_03675 [bacterium]